MANPFMIQPASYGQQLQGLAQTVEKYGEQKKQDDAKKEIETAFNDLQTAYQNNDYGTIAKISAKYPNVGNAMFQATGAQEKRQQDNITNVGFQLLSQPERFNEIVDQNPIFAQQLGGADQLKQHYQQNPQEVMDITQKYLAFTSPQKYMAYRQATSQPQKEYQLKDGVIFDPSTGKTVQDPTATRQIKMLEELKQRAKAKAEGGLKISDMRGINADVSKLTKNYDFIRQSAIDLRKVSQTKSTTDQVAAVFKFMKALDPTSVVREAEQDTARKTGGPADAMVGYANHLVSRGKLPPGQFDEMVKTAERLSESERVTSLQAVDDYLNTYGNAIDDKFKSSLRARVKPAIGNQQQQKQQQQQQQKQQPPELERNKDVNGANTFTTKSGITFTVKQ